MRSDRGRIGMLAGNLLIALACSACAGPSTPFGAIPDANPENAKRTKEEQIWKDSLRAPAITESLQKPEIDFDPTRQVLHGATEFNVIVRDPKGIPPDHKVVVLHNGYDVSPAFRSRAERKVMPGQEELHLSFRTLRTPPSQEHDIEIYYFRDRSELAPQAHAEFLAPTCKPFNHLSVTNTGTFFVTKKMLYMIERVAKNGNYSPSFVTALIAQESGFRNSAISWAKAIGMTQVTPPAETMIIHDFPEFPRYPGLNDMSVARIKALIAAGIVNGDNEWRLDDEMGVKGGVAYLGYVKEYWDSPSNRQLITENFKDHDIGLAKVILASYNSGPYRVKKALKRYGARWLYADDLGEARKYVHRIFSYCYHFSHPETISEEQPMNKKDMAHTKKKEGQNDADAT